MKSSEKKRFLAKCSNMLFFKKKYLHYYYLIFFFFTFLKKSAFQKPSYPEYFLRLRYYLLLWSQGRDCPKFLFVFTKKTYFANCFPPMIPKIRKLLRWPQTVVTIMLNFKIDKMSKVILWLMFSRQGVPNSQLI